MKTTRTLLIEQAARDHADEGTEWRDRMERWMDATWPIQFTDVRIYSGDFGTLTVMPAGKYFRPTRHV